ncbi:proteoglycan 3-like isoform X1 [Sorex araneus]|uniref:proteoglycan 3-like isoform X1 n=1 Tax=Sorex araneus TaxID=42254 RepID=UPI0024336AB0|nr:proteoglycan 3-like isoform X1 [Sorex araneus]
MKLPLLLPLLLGAVSARHLGDNVSPLEHLDTQVDISQNLDCSGEQKGQLALHGEEISSGEEEAEASDCQETFEDENDLDSDPAASGDFEDPKEEDTVQLQGTRGYKSFHPVLVKTPETFANARETCRKWYKGNLVSIHNHNTNYYLRSLSSGVNQDKVWIGGSMTQSNQWIQFTWTDGTPWNYSYWAPGEPASGAGYCVALHTKGGLWSRVGCSTLLPFICSA